MTAITSTAPATPAGDVVPFKAAPKPRLERIAAGEVVLYPARGVCTVREIATTWVDGEAFEVYVLVQEGTGGTLMVPMGKAAANGLRRVPAGKELDGALEVLKGRARVGRGVWARRAKEFEEKIKSGDPAQLAEVVRDLHGKAGQPEQSYSERMIYENALERLTSVVAAGRKVDRDAATALLLEALGPSKKAA